MGRTDVSVKNGNVIFFVFQCFGSPANYDKTDENYTEKVNAVFMMNVVSHLPFPKESLILDLEINK